MIKEQNQIKVRLPVYSNQKIPIPILLNTLENKRTIKFSIWILDWLLLIIKVFFSQWLLMIWLLRSKVLYQFLSTFNANDGCWFIHGSNKKERKFALIPVGVNESWCYLFSKYTIYTEHCFQTLGNSKNEKHMLTLINEKRFIEHGVGLLKWSKCGNHCPFKGSANAILWASISSDLTIIYDKSSVNLAVYISSSDSVSYMSSCRTMTIDALLSVVHSKTHYKSILSVNAQSGTEGTWDHFLCSFEGYQCIKSL